MKEKQNIISSFGEDKQQHSPLNYETPKLKALGKWQPRTLFGSKNHWGGCHGGDWHPWW